MRRYSAPFFPSNQRGHRELCLLITYLAGLLPERSHLTHMRESTRTD